MTHSPFATPWLLVADTVRLYCCIVGIALCGWAGAFVMRRRLIWERRLAAIALAVLAASAIGTEYQHLGTVVTYRLFTNTIGVTAGLAAMMRMRRDPPEG